MKYTKIFADENGEPHFKDEEIQLESVEYAPPAPPLNLSSFNPATKYAIAVAPPGWFGDWRARTSMIFGLVNIFDTDKSVLPSTSKRLMSLKQDSEIKKYITDYFILLEEEHNLKKKRLDWWKKAWDKI